MKKNTAGQNVNFAAIVRADGTDGTGGTPTVSVSVDGAAIATGAGTITQAAAGVIRYQPTQAETNGNHVVFVLKHTSWITQVVNVYPIDVAEYKADVAGLATAAELANVPKKGAQTWTHGSGEVATVTVAQT